MDRYFDSQRNREPEWRQGDDEDDEMTSDWVSERGYRIGSRARLRDGGLQVEVIEVDCDGGPDLIIEVVETGEERWTIDANLEQEL